MRCLYEPELKVDVERVFYINHPKKKLRYRCELGFYTGNAAKYSLILILNEMDLKGNHSSDIAYLNRLEWMRRFLYKNDAKRRTPWFKYTKKVFLNAIQNRVKKVMLDKLNTNVDNLYDLAPLINVNIGENDFLKERF